MSTIPPPAPRFTVETTLDGTRVLIPARRNWVLVAFLSLWLCGWVAGETMAAGFLRETLSAEGALFASPFLLFWLLGWTVGGAVVISVLLWNLIGKEVVTLEHGVMTIAKRIGPLGLPKRYDLSHVRDARVAPPPVRSSRRHYRGSGWPGFGVALAGIAFDYGARTFHFGADLDEAEAKYLLDILHPRLPRASQR